MKKSFKKRYFPWHREKSKEEKKKRVDLLLDVCDTVQYMANGNKIKIERLEKKIEKLEAIEEDEDFEKILIGNKHYIIRRYK